MGLFDNLYTQPTGAFGATTLPPAPTTTTNPNQNPFTALLAKLFAPTNTAGTKPATDFGALITALRATPHYGTGGNLLPTGSTGGLTPEADWRRMFPTRPTGY